MSKVKAIKILEENIALFCKHHSVKILKNSKNDFWRSSDVYRIMFKSNNPDILTFPVYGAFDMFCCLKSVKEIKIRKKWKIEKNDPSEYFISNYIKIIK